MTGQPLVSIFTPSHDPRFLDEAVGSVIAQAYGNWEHVILLNGGAQWAAPKDARVKVYVDHTLEGVGAAKRRACELTEGDILFELDHDDLLAPDALGRTVETLATSGACYSDTAQIAEDGSRNDDLFDLRYGWTYREETVAGRPVLACDSMEPLPHNLGYIWYAPNHLRAFRRDVYEAAGGYSPDRTVLDDQDLMSRVYELTDFAHISDCLYLQRVHEKNTQRGLAVNAQIQQETVQLYDAYIQDMSLAWAKRRGLLALDLGAAHNSPPGYLTVDQHGDVDLKGDVFDVLANMKDSSVGVIRAVDFLEHIADKVRLQNEIYRVLAHGGMLLSITPSTDGRGAFCDPTHVAFWNELSWRYYSDPQYAGYVPEIKTRYQVSRLVTYFPSDWHEEQNVPYVCANMLAVKDGPRLGGINHWEEAP